MNPDYSQSTPLAEFNAALRDAVRSITRRGLALMAADPARFKATEGKPFTTYLPGLALDLQTPAFQNLLPVTRQVFGQLPAAACSEELDLRRGQFWQGLQAANPELDWSDTVAHSVRVARNAAAIGAELDWAPERLIDLYWGALLHDAGKVFVEDLFNQLEAQGYPLPANLAFIRTHAALGALLMGCAAPLFPVGEQCAIQHQESMDGSGYPLGLSYPQISQEGILVGLADGYDATVTRTGWSADEVMGWEQDSFEQAGFPDAPELRAHLAVIRQNHAAWYPVR